MSGILKFKTFEQLIASVADDLDGYDAESAIDPAKLIKEVIKINKEVGLKINSEYEIVIEVKDHKAILPDNFYMLNYAVICSDYRYRAIGQSLTTENIEVCDNDWFKAMAAFPEENAVSYELCTKPYKVRKNNEVYEYNVNKIIPLQINKSNHKYNNNCHSITVNDGYVITSFETGNIIINYFGNLEDEEGNLLVLDHPIINDYYEYALKKKIFENLWLNGEDNAYNKIQYIKAELREARIKAYGIINTPEISEIVKVVADNRKRIVNKYFDIVQKSNYKSLPINLFIP